MTSLIISLRSNPVLRWNTFWSINHLNTRMTLAWNARRRCFDPRGEVKHILMLIFKLFIHGIRYLILVQFSYFTCYSFIKNSSKWYMKIKLENSNLVSIKCRPTEVNINIFVCVRYYLFRSFTVKTLIHSDRNIKLLTIILV